MIEFDKFHGAGNDFILIDNRENQFLGDKVTFAQKWCERRFGIGSDGVIFIEEDEESDFIMDFYNPDGSQSFCGNGSRCAVAFAKKIGLINKEATFKAIDGIHKAGFDGENVAILMADVTEIEQIGDDFFIDTGSPHYISYCKKEDNRDIYEYGKSIRYSEPYKENGTNVNLIKELAANRIDLRTYERGVENETFACGTGATAAALSFAHKHKLAKGEIGIKVKGGELSVTFEQHESGYTNIWLKGPAEFVFKGEIDA